jgi:hypothetical protein
VAIDRTRPAIDDRPVIDDIAQGQGGVISRRQAHSAGLTDDAIRARLSSRKWQRIFLGVYARFNGPLDRDSLLWAALLRAGRDAILSHESAAEVTGLIDRGSHPVHVSIPVCRIVAPTPGIVVHRRHDVLARAHPTRTPPQTRIEETIVDLTQSALTVGEAMGWLARGVGSRLTTEARLAAALRSRARLRWRQALMQATADVGAGCHSILELMFLRDVERAHGLPPGERQARGRVAAARAIYDDVHYRRYRTRVELDGRAAHPEHERWRDMWRDNEAVAAGDVVLRYGIADVGTSACLVAAQLAAVLRARGWSAAPVRCARSDCVIL